MDETITFPSVESVGPKVSGELIQTALLALAAAIGAMLVYIWLRFEWQFAVGAVAALVHDVLLTIGIFSLLQIRFDLATIAALLTVLGYSINDTVVIFDRLRENLIKFKKSPLIEVMNRSVNEPKPDVDDVFDHDPGPGRLDCAGGRCDPGVCVRDPLGCPCGDLFVGLCGQERGFGSGRAPGA